MDLRRSTATRRNPAIATAAARKGERNASWIASRAQPGAVVLAGGATLEHFRIRTAQSYLRQDMLPSFWSLAGVAVSSTAMFTVPLAVADASAIPARNAIQRIAFRQIDDVERFPNIAVLRFAEPADVIVGNVRKLMGQRSALDLPSLVLSWLGLVWHAGERENPLQEGAGLPSAALVQTAYGMAGIELAPGLASRSSCPEAIWQAALWWHDYYEKTADVSGSGVATDETVKSDGGARAIVPAGAYIVRQPAAAITHED
jgi:hypothetical protein